MALIIPASADEGMWLLPLLQKMNGQAMADLGCRLTPEQIYSINNSSIKDAIVQFGGGCTGEIISDQGLLVTNHHCGYGSIQKLSTPEHNYLEDGFWAMNRSQEIPVPGLTVKFLQRMDDITAVMEGAFKTAARQYKDSTNCFELCIKAQNDKAREIEKIRKELYEIIAHHTGQPFEKVFADSDRNFWMNAQEAVEYGMVDKINVKQSNL